ncbi:Protein PATRONUS 1 [Hirschfeldia incana]|nr:Protein PATRONUS 1 [Hirschfeldia incana]
MANMNTLQRMIFPDENAPIHRKKSVTAASVKTKGTALGQKKPGGTRRALNDITNKSGVQPKASSKNKQIASTAATAVKGEINIAGEMFLHDHSKCLKEQQSLWDDHFSADILLHHDSSSIKGKNLKNDKEVMDAKNDWTCGEPEEIPSPKLADWLKSSTPWRSPIRHGSMMMPSTPLAWRFDSAEFTLKEDFDDLF